MRWVEAVQAVINTLEADADLAAIDGFEVKRRGEFTVVSTPTVTWQVFSDRKEELTKPIRVQLDLFVRGIDQLLLIEGRIRELLDHDTPKTLAGLEMWAQIDDARDHDDPEPGVVHRSLDLELEPARSEGA